ncbi:hypothetical protein LWI29_026529 [Acer saccharum]|uniref:Probable purine permease n=1 Tax=Acer saccharum TaxID=4024 RepID=A0AA39RSW0_ACESA|nr:hypothetical protein LWI29_026529 [Acer saccharum]
MGEVQELQLHVMGEEDKEAKLPERGSVSDETVAQRSTNFRRWIRIAIYTFLVLSGQAAATLLGRQYYDKGGKSKWLATLVQLVGFPILLPFYCIQLSKSPERETIIQTERPSFSVLTSIYVSLGLLTAADCYLYSVGLLYLPVSTYSLICASQLAFNACFSFFLNSLKFTPFVLNSLFLLTISSTLLVFQNDDSTDTTDTSKGKYAIGFICTVAASAGYGLVLSLLQLAFKKVIKSKTFTAVLDMIVYTNLVASCVIVVGLFASSEWKSLAQEMEEYKLGKVSYVMNLVWTAITWQVFSIGSVGMIIEASSLFANAISVLGLPIVPVLAVIFFHDKMNGLKVISTLLAIWGFLSFVFQHYLNDSEEDKEAKHGCVQNEPLIPVHRPENVRHWIRIAIHAFFVLSGQSVATLLGTLYFKKGGNSKWMATLVQLAGFPVLFPYYCIPKSKKTKTVKIQTKTPSFLVLSSVYIFIGLFIAVYCYLYSVGLMYLPVSTWMA